MKKVIWLFSFVVMIGLINCGGSSSKEAKELLQKILNLVGIPQNIVVNICQDGNGNGLCEQLEIKEKLTIQKGSSFSDILNKITHTEEGKYLLETNTSELPLLLVIKDGESEFYTKEFTIPFKGLKREQTEKDLSLLDAMVDAGYLTGESIVPIKELNNSEIFHQKLLKDFEDNLKILDTKPLSSPRAVLANIKEVADELKIAGIETNLSNQIESCTDDETCVEESIKEVIITEDEAVVIEKDETKNTKELFAGKTFYVVDKEEDKFDIFKIIVNKEATSFKFYNSDGTFNKESTIKIIGNKMIFTNDNDGSYSLISQENGYVFADDRHSDGTKDGVGHRFYANETDAKKYFEEASKNGDLAKLLAGKTYYTVTDAHIGSDGQVVAPHVETMAFSSDGSSLHISWIEDGQTHNRDYTYSVTNDTLTINVENGQSLSFHNVQEFNDYIKFNEGGNFYKTEQAAKNALKLEFSDNLISQNPWYVIEEDSDTAYCNGTFTFEDNGQMTVKWNDDGQTESGTGSYSIDNGKFVTTHDGKTETETLTNTSSTALYISKVAVDATTGEHRNTMNKIWFIDRDEAEAYLSNKGVSSCFQ